MHERWITPLLSIGPLCAALLLAQPASAQSRGEMLYSLHCIECHTTQMHWRDKRLATDWNSLKLQVRRWQGITGQQWSDAEIADVTAYLNDSIYRFTPSGEPLSSLPPVFRSER